MTSKIAFGFLLLLLSLSCKTQVSTIKNTNNDVLKTSNVQNQNKVSISPILVGTNVWFTDPTDQVWDLTKQSGVKSIRIGGHAFDVKVPSNDQLINWVTRIQAMGAEPILQVSQYDIPEKAAALVKLFNIDLVTGKAIKYWNLGNEPWLQRGKPDLAKVGSMVEKYFKPRAEIMKAVDPSIKIYGPDFCYYIVEAIEDLFGGKNDISGKVPGKDYYYCDGISWHRYPQDENMNLAYEGIEDFKEAIIKCKAKVDAVNLLHNRTGDNALGWGLGEYNAKGGKQVHTWENGQMFGGILDLCMKYGATYATSWSMFEHGGDRKGTDFSFIDGENMTPRPTYIHMQMIAQNFGGNYVEGKSSLSDIITFGSVNDSKISVMIMNRANHVVSYNLNLNFNNIVSDDKLVQLNIDADTSTSYTDTIEPLSTHTLTFDVSTIDKVVYQNENFLNETLPTKTRI